MAVKTSSLEITGKPMSKRIEEIARQERISEVMAERIIKSFLTSVESSLMSGEKAVINGLCTLYVDSQTEAALTPGSSTVRATVSTAIIQKIRAAGIKPKTSAAVTGSTVLEL